MEYLLLQLIRYMKLAETVKSGKSGEEKKKFVLDALRTNRIKRVSKLM